MKTQGIFYLQQGGLRIVENDVPDPGLGEVQLRTAACGICALDTYAYRHGLLAMPFTPPMGHEGVSYVTKVGAGVKGLSEGDRVAGGSFARVSNSSADLLYKLPDSSLADEHWITEPVSCMVTALDLSNLLAGDRVAVIGCGFFGLMFLQALAHSCIDRLVGFDINHARLKLASKFGADAVYDSAPESIESNLDELRSIKFDVVIDTTGQPAGLAVAEKIVKTGGRINLFGWTHGAGTFSGDAWHLGGYTIVNSSPFGKIRDTFPAAIRLIERGIVDLRPLISHVVPLEEMDTLMKSITEGKEPAYIKGVVKLS